MEDYASSWLDRKLQIQRNMLPLPGIGESQIKCSRGLLGAQISQRGRNANYYLQPMKCGLMEPCA